MPSPSVLIFLLISSKTSRPMNVDRSFFLSVLPLLMKAFIFPCAANDVIINSSGEPIKSRSSFSVSLRCSPDKSRRMHPSSSTSKRFRYVCAPSVPFLLEVYRTDCRSIRYSFELTENVRSEFASFLR